MKITTIEQLKQRIGKYVILSHFDEECKGGGCVMKLLTRVEEKPDWITPCNSISKIFGYPIWGKYSAAIEPFIPFQPMPFQPENGNGESWSNAYAYARDPSEEEIKTFRNNWRKRIFKGVCSTNSINQLPL